MSVSETITAAASKYTAALPWARKSAGKSPGATVATTLYPYAVATPMPISVHMLGLAVRIEAMQRTKKGHAPHSTTGVASTSCAQLRTVAGMAGTSDAPHIARTRVAADSGSVHQKRRRKSTSSGFSSGSAVGITGSSAMPQMGQLPGASRRICGCIGQV